MQLFRNQKPLYFRKNLHFTQKYSFITPFFSQFVISYASSNTTSRNIGGTDTWAVLPPQLFVGVTVPPVPPKPQPMDKSLFLEPSHYVHVYVLLLSSHNADSVIHVGYLSTMNVPVRDGSVLTDLLRMAAL